MQFKRGLRLLKGVVCLLFLSNVPGAMFIQGCTFIPDSRVGGQSVDTVRFSFQIGSAALISGLFLFLDLFILFSFMIRFE